MHKIFHDMLILHDSRCNPNFVSKTTFYWYLQLFIWFYIIYIRNFFFSKVQLILVLRAIDFSREYTLNEMSNLHNVVWQTATAISLRSAIIVFNLANVRQTQINICWKYTRKMLENRYHIVLLMSRLLSIDESKTALENRHDRGKKQRHFSL